MSDIIFDVETTGLNPIEKGARITCIAAMTLEGHEFLECDDDEKKMLRRFFEFLWMYTPSKIYGFNISFDLRWVMLRALKHKLKLPFDLRCKSVDLRKILSLGEYRCKGTLDDYVSYLSLGKKLESDGKVAIQLWDQKKLVELMHYCIQDVRLTFLLMVEMKESGLL